MAKGELRRPKWDLIMVVVGWFGGWERIVMSEVVLHIGSAVVGHHVEKDGFAETDAILIDDGREVEIGAVVADGDGGVAQITGCLVTAVVITECVVGADPAGAFQEEEFVAERVFGEVADAGEVEAEAVDGFHAEGGMHALVIGVFQPAGELGVELLEGTDVAEVADEELVAHGAEEALDFSFGRAVSHRSVDEHGADARADEGELLGNVVGAVVHIHGFGQAAFVEGGLEAVDEVGCVVGVIEGTVRDDTRGVVDKADEEGFLRFGVEAGFQMGPVQGVALPHVVGVCLGEGEAGFGAGVTDGFEQIEAVDDAAEGIGRYLRALEQALLDAGAIHFGNVVVFAMEGGQDLLNGFEQALGRDLAGEAFVGSFGGVGDAVFAVVIPPGLDGSPGEADGMAVFVLEGHGADGLIAGEHGFALGVFECSEHSHSEVIADAFHVAAQSG
jgi:hypothetical protein